MKQSTTLCYRLDSSLVGSAVALETQLGWISYTHYGGELLGLVFGYTSRQQAQRALASVLAAHRDDNGDSLNWSEYDTHESDTAHEWDTVDNDFAERLREFAAGRPVDFTDVAIVTTHLTPFARRVVRACRQIPWGHTRSYGQLAAASGSPGAARAVGQVMARNRFPLVVPCHRVLASGGRMGGFSAPQGTRMKQRLLAVESSPGR